MQASVCAQDLVAAIREFGGRAESGGAVADVAESVRRHRRADDIVLLLGAGDIDCALGGIVASL